MLGTVRAPMRAPECTHAEPHPRVPHATPMPPAPLARTSCDTAHACASVEAGPRVRAPCCLLRTPHAPLEVTHTISPHRARLPTEALAAKACAGAPKCGGRPPRCAPLA